MSEHSLSSPARTTHPALAKELLAERVEEELHRLREARPHLDDRIDRASSILVVQLSSRPRTRPVRVRIHGRKARFLVSSLTSAGEVYVVDPDDWRCSCPDFNRRNQACKHVLASYILRRVARGSRKGCSACDRGWVFIGEEIVDPGTGEVAEVINPTRCRRCGDGLDHAYVQRWLESQRWIFARSRPENPHEYCLRREAEDDGVFEKVVEHLREFGHPYPWWGTVYLQYVAGSFAYWTMGAPPSETVLINRKSLERVRLDQLTNKGGGGIIWPWLHQDVEAEREELRRQEVGQDELEGA